MGQKKGSKEIIAKHLPSWMKDIDLQIQRLARASWRLSGKDPCLPMQETQAQL